MVTITLDWLRIALLLGAVQGLFLAAVLATQRRNRTANRLLAVLMVAFSVSLTTAVYHAAGLEQRFPHFFGVGYPLPLLFGPLIYLYAVSASDRSRRLGWRDAMHFLPFLAFMFAALPIYLMSGADKIAFYEELQRGNAPLLVRVVDPLKFVSGLSYTAATLLFLRRHRARVKDSYSSLERVNLQWLVRLAVANAAIWGLATLLLVTELVDHPFFRRSDDVIGLAIACLVYGVGYLALRQPEIFNYATLDYRPSPPALLRAAASPAPAPAPLPAAQAADTSAARYERSGLTDKEAARLKQALLATMDAERPYQNADLTLADLAARLDTTPHKLSEVLNAQLNQTFYDFVNAYRVQDVQRRIADQQSRNLTILALALDAGFASKSTFNHVFKQHTGRTPSAYRKSAGT
jgi:AraC-like DNA-binding protein